MQCALPDIPFPEKYIEGIFLRETSLGSFLKETLFNGPSKDNHLEKKISR